MIIISAPVSKALNYVLNRINHVIQLDSFYSACDMSEDRIRDKDCIFTPTQ